MCVCREGRVCEERESFIIYRAGGACSWSAMCVLVYKEWFSVNSLKKTLENGKSWSSNCFQALKFTHILYSEENTNFAQLIQGTILLLKNHNNRYLGLRILSVFLPAYPT